MSRHDIAAIWVAFFSGWQRYRVDRDFKTIAGIRAALAAAGSKIQGAIFEENGNQHGMSRALAQARNANRAACMGDFLRTVPSIIERRPALFS